MRCPRCGYRLSPFEDECPACTGGETVSESWVCQTCGARNPNSVRSCRECGAAHVKRKRVADARLATFGQRVFAQLIDGVVILLVVGGLVLAGLAVSPEWGLEGQTLFGLTINQFVLVVAVIFGVLYHSALVAVSGATIGKLVLSLQIVRTSGDQVGWWEAFVRSAGLFASLATLGLVFLLIVRDRSNQGVHDKLADTMVVRG